MTTSQILPRRVYFKDRSNRLVHTQDELDAALKEGAAFSPADFGYVETPDRSAPPAQKAPAATPEVEAKPEPAATSAAVLGTLGGAVAKGQPESAVGGDENSSTESEAGQTREREPSGAAPAASAKPGPKARK